VTKPQKNDHSILFYISKYASIIFSTLVLFSGFIGLFAWHTKTYTLIHFKPDTIIMFYNTALCFTLSGIALLCFIYHKKRLAFFINLMVLIIAIITLFEYFSATPLGFDQLFMNQAFISDHYFPGRMGFITIINFIALSLSLFFLMCYRFPKVCLLLAESVGIIILSLSFLIIIGYFSEIANFYNIAHFNPISLNASIGFVFFALAVISLAWYQSIHYQINLIKMLSFVIGFSLFSTVALISKMLLNNEILTPEAEYLSLLIFGGGALFSLFTTMLLYLLQMTFSKNREVKHLLSLSRATLESTADGILVLDMKGKAVHYNQQFLQMWDFNEDIVYHAKPEKLLLLLIKRIKQPKKTLSILKTLRTKPYRDSFNEIHLKDGRIFEQVSKPRQLDDTIIGRVWSYRDITNQYELETELRYIATHDKLTHLPNKTFLFQLLEARMQTASKHQRSFMVAIININKFSRYNDLLGRKGGDILMQDIVKKMHVMIPKHEIFGRLGGNQFLFVSDEFDLAHRQEVLFTLQKIFSVFNHPFTLEENTLYATCSIGATIYPIDANTIENLLNNADIAVERAKKNLRQPIEFFSNQMKKDSLALIHLQNDLQKAIVANQLEVYYQPIIELKNNLPIAVEALLRWKHPKQGFISPEVFIPIAEEFGYIHQVGEWVLLTACQQVHDWHAKNLQIKLSVNVSSYQLNHQTFIDTLINVLEKTEFMASYLELELTESAFIEKSSKISRVLSLIKNIGISISIDDFGKGYSNLSYLNTLPINKLKIDASFIKNITKNEKNHLLLKAIISVSKILGLVTVAEGVETIEQKELLEELKCEQVQGYFFAKPMPAEACFEFLRGYK
jgi:diguanylate cyclase (GGDEF)-like protein